MEEFNNMSESDLETYIDNKKSELEELWEKENAVRESGKWELNAVKKSRHKKISKATDELVEAEKVKNVGVAKAITGEKNYYGSEPSRDANLIVTKVNFKTKYDVCSDDIMYFSDYKKLYILKDKFKGKDKYYHWLNKRTEPDDFKNIKPDPIPITLSSQNKIIMEATFKVLTDEPFSVNPKLRVRDKNEKYNFEINEGKTEGEFEITFQSSNIPYEDTIKYFPNFELIFEYSEDGKSWINAGSCRNTLYLTWRDPLFSKFDSIMDSEHLNMQIKNSFNKRLHILESLLWIGCKQGSVLYSSDKTKEVTKDEKGKEDEKEQILDGMFKEFEPLKVFRAREFTDFLDVELSEGLGYWRNNSALYGGHFDRGLRGLLRNGDSRCGEFASFFIHIALTQGIEIDMFSFTSAIGGGHIHSVNRREYYNSIFLVAPWTIKDPAPPIEEVIDGNKAQGNKNPMHFFWDHVFVVFKNGDEKKYYDPSYGIKSSVFFKKDNELLRSYAKSALSGVLFCKIDDTGMPFFDAKHSKTYIDLLRVGEKELPLLYMTKTVEMDKYLSFKIYESTDIIPYKTYDEIIFKL
ncbi:MAG: hypothetical protein ACK5L5_01685 [Bacteroidales bacterium]